VAIDSAVNDKARALTVAMENHVRSLSDTLGRQANSIDESMLHGIDAVRRTSDSITRQSLHAIEGLSGQADLLKGVSENLLQQIASAASRFDQQGQSMVTAASALEKANMRMDATLQKRQGELSDTLQRLSGKTSAATRRRWRPRSRKRKTAPAP
jgi:predicted ATPase